MYKENNKVYSYTDGYKEERIFYLENFDNYFQLSVPKGVIASEKIKELIESINYGEDEFKKSLNELSSDEFSSFISKIRNYLKSNITKEFIENLNKTQFEILFKVLINKYKDFQRDSLHDILFLFFDMLEISMFDEKLEIYKNFVNEFNNDFLTLTYLARIPFENETRYIEKFNLMFV